MDNKEYNSYLKKLEEIHDKKFKDNKEYLESCKNNKNLNPKNYKIESNHKLDEYFAKYGHKLEKGHLLAFKKDELWLMDKKTTYWKIENESDFLYFEAQKNLKPLWISLIALCAAGAIAGGITAGILLNKGNGDTSKIHTLTFDTENLKIEGIEDGYQFHSGDNITFDIKKADGLVNAEAYTLPTENEISYTNLDSENVTYTAGDDKVTLSFVAPDNDVDIKMGSYSSLYFTVDENSSNASGDNMVGYGVANGSDCSEEGSVSCLIQPGQIQYSFTGRPGSWVDWDDGHQIDLEDDVPNGTLYVKNNSNTLSQCEPFSGDASKYFFHFITKGNIAVGGNINSMLNYKTMAPYAFCSMFGNPSWNWDQELTTLLDDFRLPATVLSDSCYRYMFGLATNLSKLPDDFRLPATILSDYCYYEMFTLNSFSSLPEGFTLPATELKNYCYSYMFRSCTSLSSLPEGFTLPATELASGCYRGMFLTCANLSSLPEGFTLPATELVEPSDGSGGTSSDCYSELFSSTNLSILPTSFYINVKKFIDPAQDLYGIFYDTPLVNESSYLKISNSDVEGGQIIFECPSDLGEDVCFGDFNFFPFDEIDVNPGEKLYYIAQ